MDMQKVAAYCRVSTDKDDQANSLENQKDYFSNYIKLNPLWELTKIYVDEGITGTNTKKRQAFHQMISDAKEHKMDLILTKEISRFARNTLDSIYYTRFLKELGIGVLFMNDNINTLDADAELRLTIMSSIAQEESRKTSERVKWGQKRSMEQGIVFGRSMLGYHVINGRLVINEQGAELVKLIYHKFVYEGKSTHLIAKELNMAGVPTINDGCIWHNNVILRILKNEKYCGDLIQKKTFTPNYLNHEKKTNHGQEELVELLNHHEPIISKELFLLAREELQKRSPKDKSKLKYSNRYLFSGKVKCGLCDSSFVSRTKKNEKGIVSRSWKCYKSLQYGKIYYDSNGNNLGCQCPQIREEYLKQMLMYIIKNMKIDRNSIADNLISKINPIINEVHMESSNEKSIQNLSYKISKLNTKKDKLLELYMENMITKDEYLLHKNKLEGEIDIYNLELTSKLNESELEKGVKNSCFNKHKEKANIVYRDENDKGTDASKDDKNKDDKRTEISKGDKSKDNKSKDDNRTEISKGVKSKENKNRYDYIMNSIKSILAGEEWSDAFYQTMLDKIVVYGTDKIDVYIKFSPEKWCFKIN
jgi:site-specific DNA recombinase